MSVLSINSKYTFLKKLTRTSSIANKLILIQKLLNKLFYAAQIH